MPDPSLEECEAFCQSLLDKFGWSPDVGTFHTYDGRDREMLKAILEHLRRLRPTVAALESANKLLEQAKPLTRHRNFCGYKVQPCDCGKWQFDYLLTEHEQALATFKDRSK